jgi:4-amino-4-deoxy-L-arabinose transferase-like glycosyltransferase
MDTPAACVLVWGFYGFVRGMAGEERGRVVWLFVCGLLLGLAYTIRGLAAFVFPVPFLAIGLSQAKEKKQSQTALGCGLGLALLIYLIVWYLPNRDDLAKVNHYYLFGQLMPHDLNQLRQNLTHNFFGDERGFSSYLFRHTPVQFTLLLLGIGSWGLGIRQRKENEETGKQGNGECLKSYTLYPTPCTLFLILWLLCALGAYSVVRYAPPRYYVLFHPALAALSALTLRELRRVVRMVWASRATRALLGGFLAYHLAEAFLHHHSMVSDIVLYGFVAVVTLVLATVRGKTAGDGQSERANRRYVVAAMALWAAVNLGWMADWLMHLSYRQRDADLWLARHFPPGSVLIGDAAPGLCLRNRFVAVPVIPGLCNYERPVERFAPSPRGIVLLDGARNEGWWRRHYPEIVRPERRTHHFERILHFAVSVYAVSE